LEQLERFHCNIDERLIRETADAMVASGMRDAGYQYVNIDDCWEAAARDANGNLQADSARFPSGLAALASYVHARNHPWLWGRTVGAQLWRTTGDIGDRWSSVLKILDQQVGLEKYSGPNGWNDPDMLRWGMAG